MKVELTGQEIDIIMIGLYFYSELVENSKTKQPDYVERIDKLSRELISKIDVAS